MWELIFKYDIKVTNKMSSKFYEWWLVYLSFIKTLFKWTKLTCRTNSHQIKQLKIILKRILQDIYLLINNGNLGDLITNQEAIFQ